MVLSCEKYCSFGLSISESLALGMQTILPSIPTYLEIALGYSHAHFFNIDSIDDLVKTIISAKDSPVEIDDIYRFRQKNNFNNAIEKYYNLLLGEC
jgi:glycosyltransferase involved in cell wall biosynthesis